MCFYSRYLLRKCNFWPQRHPFYSLLVCSTDLELHWGGNEPVLFKTGAEHCAQPIIGSVDTCWTVLRNKNWKINSQFKGPFIKHPLILLMAQYLCRECYSNTPRGFPLVWEDRMRESLILDRIRQLFAHLYWCNRQGCWWHASHVLSTIKGFSGAISTMLSKSRLPRQRSRAQKSSLSPPLTVVGSRDIWAGLEHWDGLPITSSLCLHLLSTRFL